MNALLWSRSCGSLLWSSGRTNIFYKKADNSKSHRHLKPRILHVETKILVLPYNQYNSQKLQWLWWKLNVHWCGISLNTSRHRWGDRPLSLLQCAVKTIFPHLDCVYLVICEFQSQLVIYAKAPHKSTKHCGVWYCKTSLLCLHI